MQRLFYIHVFKAYWYVALRFLYKGVFLDTMKILFCICGIDNNRNNGNNFNSQSSSEFSSQLLYFFILRTSTLFFL